MRSAIAMAACALAACGDDLAPVPGAPLAPSDRVVIVAHTDDDLLFAQPDLDNAIARGERVTIVFTTQGLASESQHAIDVRVDGSETVYGKVARRGAWSCGWITVAQLPIYECKLADRPLALVYLGYPAGGKYGEHVDSLLHLWQGTIPYTWTIGSWWAPVDREQLIATTAEILRVTQPRTIMTGDLASVHGRDHSDHMLTAALTVLAAARAGSPADIVSYRGYNTDRPPSNKP